MRRGFRALSTLNQSRGFDCPGCAWPDPEPRGAFEFCENGAKAVAHEATTRRIGAGFFAEWPVERLRAQSDHWLEQQGRLAEPLWRPAGAQHYQPIRWDEAFARVARCAAGAGVAGPGRLLHLRPHQQRGRVPVPALRAAARHEQPPRLLEHVSRVERRRARRVDRRRQGHGRAGRLRARGRDLRDRPEPGQQPPAHADGAAGGQAAAAAASSP